MHDGHQRIAIGHLSDSSDLINFILFIIISP